jgi:hypothetical protein
MILIPSCRCSFAAGLSSFAMLAIPARARVSWLPNQHPSLITRLNMTAVGSNVIGTDGKLNGRRQIKRSATALCSPVRTDHDLYLRGASDRQRIDYRTN